MGKNNKDVLTIGAIVAGVIFLPKMLEKGVPLELEISGFGSGDSPGLGLDFSGLFDGLRGMLEQFSGGIDLNIPQLPDFSGLFGGTVKLPDQAPHTPPIWQEPRYILDQIGKTGIDLSNAAVEAAKAAGIGAGAYLGLRALSPVAPRVGGAVANTIANAGGVVGRFLTSPVSAVSKVPATLGVVAAGAAGYGVGTLINKTQFGQNLIEKSGALGAKTAAEQGWLGRKIFPTAQPAIMSEPTVSNFEKKYGITWDQAQGMSTAALQELIANTAR